MIETEKVDFRDYVWECDYGEHSFILAHLREILEQQNAFELAYCFLYANNNPYNLEFFVVFGYEFPTPNQIQFANRKMELSGAKYRPDLTNQDLQNELKNSRFQFLAANDLKSIDIGASVLFWFEDRSTVAKRISMKPLGRTKTIFLSHSSVNKPFVEELIPYLNAKNLPFWYDKVNIDYGETIVTAVQNGLLESGVAIFLITEEFLNSSWCKSEMEGFLSRFGSGHDVLLISLVDKKIPHEKLPLFLQMKKYLRLNDEFSAKAVALELTPILTRHLENV